MEKPKPSKLTKANLQ